MSKANTTTLDAQYAGVNSPEQMGTTGLIAWVLHGLPSKHSPRNRWERLNCALRIVGKRKLDQERFCSAVMSTAEIYGINLYRMFRALEKRGLARRMLAGDC